MASTCYSLYDLICLIWLNFLNIPPTKKEADLKRSASLYKKATAYFLSIIIFPL
jgi:hypothetical protein